MFHIELLPVCFSCAIVNEIPASLALLPIAYTL